MRKTILVGGPSAIEWAISQAEKQSRETETLIDRQRLRNHADALRVIRSKMGWHPSSKQDSGTGAK